MDKNTISDDMLAKINNVLVEAVDGCQCPSGRPWYRCDCATTTHTYQCVCDNYKDVLTGEDMPWDLPTVEAVAELINLHPGAKIVYIGCRTYYSPEHGHGDHFELAKKLAKTQKTG